MSKQTEAAADKAAEILRKNGVETYMILVKCPDSQEFILKHCGNRPYLVAVGLNCLDYIRSFFKAKPPSDPGYGGFDA